MPPPLCPPPSDGTSILTVRQPKCCDCTATAPRPEGRGAVRHSGRAGPTVRDSRAGSAALDVGRVLEDTAAAVLHLRQQALAALLHRQVPDAGGEFGDRRGGTVLREQR